MSVWADGMNSGLSWSGFRIQGDAKSIKEVKRLIDLEARANELQEIIFQERTRASRDDDLLRNAIRVARPRRDARAPRWAAVMEVFTIGSTSAQDLCRRFGFDPDETVRR